MSTKMGFAFLALLVVLDALACGLATAYSQSALLSRAEWELTKRDLPISLLGADEALLTRSLVARGVFHGDAWYGYQEVVSREAFRPTEVAFRFRILSPLAHVSLVYGAGPGGFHGLRFSRHPDFPSAAFDALPSGLFHLRRDLPELRIADDDFHEARVRFFSGHAEVVLDHALPVALPPEVAGAEGRVGVRGGFAAAEVSEVSVRSADGRAWTGRFDGTAHLPRILFFQLAAIAACSLGAYALLRRRSSSAVAAQRLGLGLVLLLLLAASEGIFDWVFWSSRRISAFGQVVPHDRTITRALEITRGFERLRYAVVGGWYAFLAGERHDYGSVRRAGYPRAVTSQRGGGVFCDAGPCRQLSPVETDTLLTRPKRGRRVLFVGTSQTFGSGASNLEKTFFAESVRFLQESEGRSLEGLNIALVAGRGEEVAEMAEAVAPAYHPDLVVIDMVENLEPAHLRAIYDRIFTAAAGVKTVVLAEGVTYEAYRPPVGDGVRVGTRGEVVPEQYQNRAKHELLRALAHGREIPVLPLEEYLHGPSVRDAGFLWWDHVHLTDAGHELVAKWLAPQLAKVLRAKNRGDP